MVTSHTSSPPDTRSCTVKYRLCPPGVVVTVEGPTTRSWMPSEKLGTPTVSTRVDVVSPGFSRKIPDPPVPPEYVLEEGDL